MSSKEWQRNYYQKHKTEFQKKHREYARKVSLGLIIPKIKKEIAEVENWRQPKCPICFDDIFGKPHKTYYKGKIIIIDEGCYLWLRAVDKQNLYREN